VISANGITPDPEKIEILKNFKRPTSVVEIQSFLGLASYFRRFIKYFADIAHPLIELTKGKKLKDNRKSKTKRQIRELPTGSDTFLWGDAEQAAFEQLRECLTTPPVVAFPDFDKEFLIFTDASNYGIGAVLINSVLLDGRKRIRLLAKNVCSLKPFYQRGSEGKIVYVDPLIF
jgi:hypothetical protein